MKFKLFNESLDKPYKLELQSKGAISQYGFLTSDEVHYLVSFNSGEEIIHGKMYNHTLMSFEDEQGSMNITAAGNAFRVFATVLSAFKKESKRIKKSDYISFGADASEPSRIKLYRRLVKMLKYKYQEEVKYKGNLYFLLSQENILDDVSGAYKHTKKPWENLLNV